jgi:deoxyribodipyrimidine photolyase-related protein
VRELRPPVQLAETLARLLGTGPLLLRALSTRCEAGAFAVQLILLLGDQLDRQSPALDAYRSGDRVLMIESREESQRVWSHKTRSSLFLAAMRHHRDWLLDEDFALDYVTIDRPEAASFDTGLNAAIDRHRPSRLVMTRAGEFGVQRQVEQACQRHGIDCDLLPDTHFLCSVGEFAEWRHSRKSLVMETFYRHMRQRYGILVEDGKPVGDRWNFDKENRKPFGREGPGMLPSLPKFTPDSTTREAIADIERHFEGNPGSTAHFGWPVTREQALSLLDDFVSQRLPAFGPFQDAMWTGEPYLHHSALSAAMNLKLLHPREVIDAAVQAADDGRAPLASVEGFVRQVLGWREYVRGVYWSEMPGYLDNNALDAEQPLPAFYWTGDTDMVCLRETIDQTLQLGYAHHIQRLMVTGLFALLLGVRPSEIHAWYLAVYVDAVEWVEAPNTLGMSQYADGGLLASKPYAASGKYIQRMSNFCRHCRYRPDKKTGDDACPFTTLYWDFLDRHQDRFAKHPRAAMQWRNLGRLDDGERRQVRAAADHLRQLLS